MNVYQMLAYESVRTFLSPWVSFALRVRSEGIDNIPDEGPAVLACNHPSDLDQLMLMNEIPREIHFVAGAKGFVIPLVKTFSRMTSTLRSHKGGNGQKAMGMDEAVQMLGEGELIGVFPEGVESDMRPDRTSNISYFRTGFARAALEAGAPIIPVAIIPGEELKVPVVSGTLGRAHFRHGSPIESRLKFILRRSVLLRVGKPIELEEFEGRPLTKPSIDMLSGKVRQVIIKLYNGEQLDRFLTGELPFDIYTDRI
jgi:1-acyl-sn-glycerol-3-phosphate acyltransferase